MEAILAKYIPEQAVAPCMELIAGNGVHLKIVSKRHTRHGDYRRMPDGRHMITVNAGTNPYRFLITLIHEIAHLVAFERFGRAIKPHGKEWKHTFQQLMLPFLRPQIFPQRLLPVLAHHFKNPKASSSTDSVLALALAHYDQREEAVQYVYQIPEGGKFRWNNGKVFQRGVQLRKRFQCMDLATGKLYLFQPHAEIEPL